VLFAITLLKNPPEGWQPHGLATVHEGMNAVSGTVSFTFSQAIKTPQFWILWFILFLAVTAGLGLISQLSPMAQDVMKAGLSGDLSAEQMRAIVITSGTIVAIGAIFNGIGRLTWGWISDTVGRKAVFAALFMTQAAGFILLAHTGQMILFAALVCYLLACYGGSLASMPAFVADEFGPEHIGIIYGTIFTGCALGGIAGPYLFAYIKDLTDSFISNPLY